MTQGPQRTATGPYSNVAGQFTRFGTLSRDGDEIENSLNQRLNSSVTQLTLGYNFTSAFGVNIDAPFIYREYQRVRRFEVEDDQTVGVGDISLLANWSAVRFGSGNRFFGLKFSAGVKLPTGESDRLQEEAEEPVPLVGRVLTGPTETLVSQFRTVVTVFNGRPLPPRLVFVGFKRVVLPAESNEGILAPAARDPIRGKDLALGSGSIDGIAAVNLYTQWHRFFLAADARYTYRTEGAYDYEFADTFQWSGGPGLYAIDGPDLTVGIQLICSGEIKGEDEFRGQDRKDTELTAVFLGPNITATWKDRFSAQVGGELPVHIDNSGLQAVPDFRVQASISWQF